MLLDQKRSTLALLALAISAFAIGTTEFISVGLLPLIADDLNISVSTSALTVTLYALGVTFGAPILTSLTSGIPRKALLLWIMLVFIVGNTLAATANGIVVLLIARMISALSHGVFMSIGSTIAADLVPENRRASAIAFMFSGLTVATVTGVPLGTFIGQQLGWRAAFIGIVAVGILAFLANIILIPSDLRKGTKTPLREQLTLITNGRLLLAFLITAIGYGGTFVVFTYLSPLLHEITGFKETTVAIILLGYGIAIAIGNIIGGKAANRKPISALFYMFTIQSIILFVLTFTAPFKVVGLLTILLMGLLAFMNVPGLQVYVVMLAERYAPKAVDVASAMNIAAFNAGIAIGAYLGGLVTDKLGLIHTPWVGALMVLGAVLLTGLARALERKDKTTNKNELARL
ncbi:MFS transporter [Brevibacillus laterosporus]|uniref:Inner membrane transport protein YdhP n=1 Tax=Brevibacillus laterosporus LMG 15441 TaxID=1042163 RepID=A0A075RIB3_BRELA|nr:MFS transporter [Brevibacillus laterosporus]AIG28880.1 inner membrane transport protein YdhP [Brevibacillus laterosporus LMG 15441]RJL08183.1 MFS transporter [Brevibacillus laterosporus]TPH19077.1 MFS transporter [Brevibacillus laterosporus]